MRGPARPKILGAMSDKTVRGSRRRLWSSPATWVTALIVGFAYGVGVNAIFPVTASWSGLFLCGASYHLSYQQQVYNHPTLGGQPTDTFTTFTCATDSGAVQSVSQVAVIASQFALGVVVTYLVAVGVIQLVRRRRTA